MKLLVVDDSTVVRRLITRQLADGGFTEVIEARNGYEAIEKYTTHRPDVVTMDITMPELDGVAAVEAIVGINPEAKILIISAMSDKLTAISAVQKGARGFLLKPFTQERLEEAIQEILND